MARGPAGKRSALGMVLAVVAMSSGCRWIPVRPGDTPASPVRPESPSPKPSPVLPPLAQAPPLRPITDQEAFQVQPKTEILDAAAVRDDEVKKAIAESVMDLQIPPPSAPVAEAPRQAESTGEVASPAAEVVPSATIAPPRVPDLVPDPSRQWRAEVEHLLVVARENARSGGDSGDVWATRERVLTCLAEPEESSLWKSVVSALASPPQNYEEAEPAKAEVAPVAPPEVIADLQLCRRVLGFGKTEPLATDRLKPGQEVLLYAESDGLAVEPAKDGFRSRLTASLAIFSADGQARWSRDFEVEDWCRRRRRDFFVGYSFAVPADLPPGDYQVRLTQKDLIANREAAKVVPFTVVR